MQIKRILVPVDFSERAGEALRYASSLAVPLGAELDVLHVCEVSVVGAADTLVM